MVKTILCLLLLACNLVATLAAEPATNTASQTLITEASVMPLKAGKATQTFSPLTRTNGVYVGDFKVAVFPYFFKSDHGRLAINVTDESLAAVNQGLPAGGASVHAV